MTSPEKRLEELKARPAGQVVIARPGSWYRWIYVAKALGTIALAIGAFVCVLGLLALPLGFLAAGTNPLELLFPAMDETNNEPTNWLVQAGGWAVFGGLGLTLAGYGLDGAAEVKIAGPDIVTAGEIVNAPTRLARPLVRALDAAETIRRSAAVREGWLTGIDVDAALWNLAQQFNAGVHLDGELRAAYDQVAEASEPDFRGQIDAAEAAVLSCTERLREGTQRLVDIADRVASFDRELSEPARRAELTKERERNTRRTREQVAKLTAARTAVENIEPVLDNVADIAAGQLDAYGELPKIEKI
ncbi:hypothetical protein HG717_01310 [Rhodococcus erythropolis]|uniref:hypothetical protein n=1 Tax=Rhodococcus TaxID=1827 RepID=UPI001AE497AE|nr:MULTISPECIES: hypothetical protein [Rhodococcus]MBP2520954.1 hypothetical protein [Rhodococcus sp. PvP104]MBY6382550.1 hypothetical protein [Rhodococcus erythropolis]